jgi:LysR family transcriptional regulator, regulator for metE and metH
MNSINLHQFKIINAIANEGSMTKAADLLYLSQSALSHQIKEVENNLGTAIFNRYNKKLLLTEVGRTILNTSEIILVELQKLEKHIENLTNNNSGKIRISTECYSSYNWLPKLIVGYTTLQSKITIKIITEATSDTQHFLENGLLDIAITSRPKPIKSKFKYTKIFDDQLVVVINKNNLLSNKKSILPIDFENQTLLTYDVDDEDLDILYHVLKPDNIPLGKIIKLPLTEVIIEMVKANQGITVMANWIAKPLLNEDLVTLPLKHPFAKRTWYMVSHQHENKLHQEFIDYAIENLKYD